MKNKILQYVYRNNGATNWGQVYSRGSKMKYIDGQIKVDHKFIKAVQEIGMPDDSEYEEEED